MGISVRLSFISAVLQNFTLVDSPRMKILLAIDGMKTLLRKVNLISYVKCGVG